MQSSDWAPEHSDALREHLARGLAYSEIARAINAKFGTAYSRNATIGRARRMGLAGSGRPKDWAPLSPRAQQPSLRKLREYFAAEFRRWVPIFESVENLKLRCVDVDPRHLSLFELAPGDCRYPYGGDEEGEAISFCGHPVQDGTSYCAAHFELTRGPGTVPVRRADVVLPEIVGAA